MAKKRVPQTLALGPSLSVDVRHLNSTGFRSVQVPRFDEVELVSGPSPELDGDPQLSMAPEVRETLWNASVKEIERLTLPGSDWVVEYRREDLVFVPRDEFEARLWTFAYPNMRAPAAVPAGPRARLRNPNLSDARHWRPITLGEFHRQRRFYGLQSEKGRIACIRTLDGHRMLRIPLSELRNTAPLFSRMLEPSEHTHRSAPVRAVKGIPPSPTRSRSHSRS